MQDTGNNQAQPVSSNCRASVPALSYLQYRSNLGHLTVDMENKSSSSSHLQMQTCHCPPSPGKLPLVENHRPAQCEWEALWVSYNPVPWGAWKKRIKEKKSSDAVLFTLAWCLSTLMTSLVKHTVGWPQKVPENQNLDIQLWLSTLCQSQSGFEVLETFCLLSCVSLRFSNQVSLLWWCKFMVWIDLSRPNSSARYITPDTKSSVWSEWRNIYVYLSS